MCDPGLIYWICPVYAGGRYAGALAAGGVSAGEGRRLVENIRRLELEKTAGEKAEEYAVKIPVKDHEEIKALARLLRVCTERLENNTGEGGEGIRRPWDEELKANRAPRPAADAARQTNPAYPLDQERLLLAAMRRGDNETGRKILNELLEIALVSNPGNIKIIRLRAIELATLLSRAAAGDDAGDSSILEINDHCIRKIQESKNMEELAGSLYLVLDRVAGRLFSFKGIRHASALRRAERFIRENYTRKISLRETAEISGLSAPYFSTIFREEMGENFSTYINRLRVEKAALMMRETGMILNEIAEACGFEDQSWFSKIFKSHTGMSPGKYRDKCGGLRFSEGEEIERWGR
jgi:AraC-like DNA-binding protein